jgi:2-polyprenyl-6-methoxyphenol hydroxylase-like FAD-dependent oxidoreductase
MEATAATPEKLQFPCCIAGGGPAGMMLGFMLVRYTMSPIGGVRINLAIQDVIAAANFLTAPLRRGGVALDHLAKVQRRRGLPTRLTQGFRVIIQKQLIARVLATPERLQATMMHASVASNAKRNQVVRHIAAQLTPRFHVMDLQVFH